MEPKKTNSSTIELSSILQNLPADILADLKSAGTSFDIDARFQEENLMEHPGELSNTDTLTSTVVEESSIAPDEMDALLAEPIPTIKADVVIPSFEDYVDVSELEQAPALVAIESVQEETIVEEELNESSIVDFSEALDTLEELDSTITALTKNEEVVTIKDSELRFSGASWFEKVKETQACIVGAGGIGSWTAVLLAKMGMTFSIFDDDNFEPVNIAGQLFLLKRRTVNKAYAVAELCANMVPESHVYAAGVKVDEHNIMEVVKPSIKIIISAVDNMATRTFLFNSWVELLKTLPVEDRKNYLFIDGRLTAESYQLYSLVGNRERAIIRYRSELFTDAEADALVCSFKQTAFTAALLSGRIANNIVNFCSPEDGIPRAVPFFIEYDAFGLERVINYA